MSGMSLLSGSGGMLFSKNRNGIAFIQDQSSFIFYLRQSTTDQIMVRYASFIPKSNRSELGGFGEGTPYQRRSRNWKRWDGLKEPRSAAFIDGKICIAFPESMIRFFDRDSMPEPGRYINTLRNSDRQKRFDTPEFGSSKQSYRLQGFEKSIGEDSTLRISECDNPKSGVVFQRKRGGSPGRHNAVAVLPVLRESSFRRPGLVVLVFPRETVELTGLMACRPTFLKEIAGNRK